MVEQGSFEYWLSDRGDPVIIDHETDTVFITFSLIMVIVCIAWQIIGVIWYRRLFRMQELPTSKIRSIAMGPVEVFGTVVQGKESVHDYEQNDLVYYKDEHQPIFLPGKAVPFYVKDSTGKVLVNPKKARFDLGVGVFRLAPGDQVYVSGYAGDNPAVEDTTGKRNEDDILITNGPGPFFISNRPVNQLVQLYLNNIRTIITISIPVLVFSLSLSIYYFIHYLGG
ncbi:TPA: hypothetical protein HA265_07055 [Candidatus Woesearchaeota archaeon]|nr:hypothetical protein [Candidatus Woesearchaeota archaeon]